MGLLGNLFGTNPQYTLTDNKSGDKRQVQDAKDLEKIALNEQKKDKTGKPAPLAMRIFGTTGE